MIASLTGSLTNTKLGRLYGDVGQDGLFISYFNVMSELMLPSLTGIKLESLHRNIDQDSVKCYVGIDVPQPNWHKVYDVSLFGGVA